MESAPTLDNLRHIASLKGWTIDQLMKYLKEEDVDTSSYLVDNLIAHAKKLPAEERMTLIKLILE